MKISKNLVVGLIPVVAFSLLLSYKVYPVAPTWVSILAFIALFAFAVMVGIVAANLDDKKGGWQ